MVQIPLRKKPQPVRHRRPHPWPGRPAHRRWGVLVAALLVTACTAVPEAGEYAATTVPAPDLARLGHGRDGRARFRQILCDVARRDGLVADRDTGCDGLLWRLADEPPAEEPGAAAAAPDKRLKWFVVTGALGDCFGEEALPFTGGIARLRSRDADIRVVRVSGRSGSAHNARQIAAAVEAADLAPEDPVVLLGYSKGAVDILEFLVSFPGPASQVVAAVSIAGPILGSPIAELGEWAYANLFSGAFEDRCDPGDGGVVASLVPERRRQWLLDHPLPPRVRYLSLAAFTTRPHLARGLLPTWEVLANTDTRNDGQVLIGDAVIPGSDLLGYANADHWGIALTIEESLPGLAARTDPAPYPRASLIEAVFLYVSEVLPGP